MNLQALLSLICIRSLCGILLHFSNDDLMALMPRDELKFLLKDFLKDVRKKYAQRLNIYCTLTAEDAFLTRLFIRFTSMVEWLENSFTNSFYACEANWSSV